MVSFRVPRSLRQIAKLSAQALLIGAAFFFLGRQVYERRETLARLAVAAHPLPLIAASLLTLAGYALMVGTWSWCLRWWGQRLSYATALRIWFLSNLARFIPGAVWQFAGLASMSAEAGVSPVAAMGGVLLQQVVALATGLAVTLAFAPQALAALGYAVPPAMGVPLAVVGLVALVAIVPLAAPRLQRLTSRFARAQAFWPKPPISEFAGYVAALVLPWVAYGVAFWLFGVSLFGAAAPGLWLAASVFTASYVAGILVVIAPGGIGVREAALTLLLTPAIGADRALFLAVTSRLWLTLVEILGALSVLALSPRRANPTSAL